MGIITIDVATPTVVLVVGVGCVSKEKMPITTMTVTIVPKQAAA